MHKKLLSGGLAVCFLILAVPLTEGAAEHSTEQTVTFAKCLPDGTIEYVEQTVDIAAGESPSSAISERCAAIMEDDERFQDVMEQQVGLYLIISGGDGFHMALPPALLEIRLLRISFNLIPSIIFCSYSDSEATTTITPLSGGDGVVSYDGPHKLLTAGFIGIIGWSGVFSFASTGLAGLTFFVWTPGEPS